MYQTHHPLSAIWRSDIIFGQAGERWQGVAFYKRSEMLENTFSYESELRPRESFWKLSFCDAFGQDELHGEMK